MEGCCPEGCLPAWMDVDDNAKAALETPPRFKVAEKKTTLRGTTAAGASHCPPELREWVGNKTAGIKNSVTQDDGTAIKKTCKYDGRESNWDKYDGKGAKTGKPCADATRDSVVYGHPSVAVGVHSVHCCPEGCLPAWMGVDDK